MPESLLTQALAEERLLREWARDLSTLTADEILPRWSDSARSAIDSLAHQHNLAPFSEQLVNHNPLYYLAERVFFDNDPALLYAPLHRDIVCKEFTDYCFGPPNTNIAGLLLLIQRDSFKSTFSHGVLPLGWGLRNWHLTKDIPPALLTHHKANQASDNLERLKTKMLHPWMKVVWPEFTTENLKDCGTKYDFNWPCEAGGRRSESSVMAAGMGARMTGYHFGLRINDDIVTEEHRDSKLLRDEAFEKYTAMRFLRDTRRSWEVNTGTPYHPNDLWSKLIKANVEGEALYRARLIGAIGDDDSLSFPTRHTREYLDRIRQEEYSRSGNDDYFQLQMLCRYRSTRMIAAQWEWVKHCKQEEVPPTAYRVITVDPAWKGTENSGEGDFASIQVWAMEKRGSMVYRYLIDGLHANDLTDAEGRHAIFEFMRKYGVVDVAPEEHGGKAFKQALRNEAQTRGTFINIIDLKTSSGRGAVSKSQRITTFLGECQLGRTFICEEVDFELKEHFKDEFENFPQVDHEDALDAAAYTNDPAISERIVPQWNDQTKPWWQRTEEPEQPRRTRYCQL